MKMTRIEMTTIRVVFFNLLFEILIFQIIITVHPLTATQATPYTFSIHYNPPDKRNFNPGNFSFLAGFKEDWMGSLKAMPQNNKAVIHRRCFLSRLNGSINLAVKLHTKSQESVAKLYK